MPEAAAQPELHCQSSRCTAPSSPRVLGPLPRLVSRARVLKSAARHRLQVGIGVILLQAGRKESSLSRRRSSSIGSLLFFVFQWPALSFELESSCSETCSVMF